MKQYLLFPFEGGDNLNNRIFESPYGVLRDLFQRKGIELATYDRGNLSTADRILCFSHAPKFYRHCCSLGISPEKMVLFLFEPSVVIPRQYSAQVWNGYGTIFTVRDDLVDNKKFFKLRFPQGQSFPERLVPYRERHFLTLINANKYSYVPRELYSYRREAIRAFDHDPGFALFGHKWNNRNNLLTPSTVLQAMRYGRLGQYVRDLLDSFHPFVSYKGSLTDKYATLGNYRYCLCFENEREAPGYITEKIFDCFFTGTIPIYLGAPNITDYVPKEAFIDMNRFANFQELTNYLYSLQEADFLRFQKAGQTFIESTAFKSWQPTGVFREIVQTCLKNR